jgi:acyl dehydratase
MSIDDSAPPLAEWLYGEDATVSAAHMAAFADAVGENDLGVLDGEVMAPTYPIVLGWESQSLVLDAAVSADLLWLHGEQAFEYDRPIRPGMLVRNRSRVAAIAPKRTGTSITLETEILDLDTVCCTQLFTLFVVGHHMEARGSAPPLLESSLEPAAVLGQSTDTIDVDQPQRYAEVSGDDYGIHLDDEIARAFGLPGRIVHGMTTLAVAARVVRDVAARAGHPHLTSLGGRFAAPVLPGAQISTVVRGQVSGRQAVLAFESTSASDAVITRGRATASPSQNGTSTRSGA